ncbi:MAG: DNA alkylation repair protein [Magnetococcales bacterium]|nr:DNA alkylation repair protein [Magnetococcales bacterium]
MSAVPHRKGYNRQADIPDDLRQGLNCGEAESRTLSEWLAVDRLGLLMHVLPAVGLAWAEKQLQEHIQPLVTLKVTGQMKGIGKALDAVCRNHAQRQEILEALSVHPSDTVRAWGAYMLRADETLPLPERLDSVRRYATDGNMCVRECAWDSFRPYVAADLDTGLALLAGWVVDPDANIRRCAVEGTRPCGVWTAHIPVLKADPALGLGILEPVRADPSRYVQTAVGNWLNDAGKSQPDWACQLTQQWLVESPCPETAWIVKHGRRRLNCS